MIEQDAPNPYLADEDSADTLGTGIHALVASAALTVNHDPAVTTQFVTCALANLSSVPDVGDASAAMRALLFEVSRYVHNHVDPNVPIIEGERPAEHEEAFKRDARTRVVTMAATEWFRLTCGQKDQPAANVLKAIHKELPLPMIPTAMLYVATISLCSLAASVAYQILGEAHHGHQPHTDDDGDGPLPV